MHPPTPLYQILYSTYGNVSSPASPITLNAESAATSVSDPDPLVRSVDPGSGTRRVKIHVFKSAGYSLWRAEGSSFSLDVLYGGLGICKFQYLIKKLGKNIFSFKFIFIFWSSKLWIRIRISTVFSLKCWIRIRNQ